MATLIWRPCATCSAQSEWLCIIENAAPLKSARLRGFGGAACVLGEMCEGAGALARVLENEGCVPGRCIALSRRCVGALYRIVNCGPAKCCVWPVLAPAEGIVRAGGWSAGQSKSVAAFFVRIMTGVRFYWNVLRSIHACHAFLLECFSFDYAWCLPPVRQTERLAICCVPIPPWGEIAIRAFSNRRFDYQFSPRFTSGLSVSSWRSRQSTREQSRRRKIAFA